jgi:hypothetical protein
MGERWPRDPGALNPRVRNPLSLAHNLLTRGAAMGSVICLVACGSGAPAATPEEKPRNDDCAVTAADVYRWGRPNREDNFTDASSLTGWVVYDGPGHAGNGRRTPDSVSISDGVLTITGDAKGNSGGMGWLPGQLHGRWEACVKSSVAPASYHSLVLLWPDAEDWPVGGEIDFMEIVDPTRQSVDAWIHYGPGSQKERTITKIDATQWHSYAVEWTPSHIVYYVDAEPRWEILDPVRLPPRAMHLCLQLDYFGGDTGEDAHQMVDWVRQYDLGGGEP